MTQAIYAYIPVVHSGVLTLLDKYPNTPLWILDNEKGISENVYLERDMRALPASKIKLELEALGYQDLHVVDHHELEALVETVDELIVPNDEIVEFFIEKFAPGARTKADTMFLRWTKQISTTEFVVPPDRVISTDTFHNEVMKNLVEEAEKSTDWWRQISAMLVKGGKQIAVSHNKHLPSPNAPFVNGDPRSNLDAGQGPGVYTSIHAEASAIAQAARMGIATEGCEIFVSTFPCPTCARLMVEAGIERVYYGKGYSLLDAEDILKNADIEIVLVKEKD
jgi:dCMP deaminase